MTNWYTADLHFGHDNIIRFCDRPFRDAGHMDRVLIDNLWSCVGPSDDLWILGDFAWGERRRDQEWLCGVFDKLPGARKHLVIGNHDKDATLALPWSTVTPLAEVKDGEDGLTHTLCHYPMVTWNRARRGALQLFGHVHENWRGTRNAVNVGVDVWDFKPVRIEEVARRAATQPVNQHWADAEPRAELEDG